ncbi:hypothetical protein [Dactylosporangium sp. CS-033363]|uniref:hypothetical protein n=1 Tax=Dactylosporangium sp. CS-033363 TaxID=3239935 RepID=UPI003D90C6A2
MAPVLGQEPAAPTVPMWWQIAGPVVIAVVSLLGAVYAARMTWRAATDANRSANVRVEHERDAALDARVDAAVMAAWARIDVLTVAVHRWESDYAALQERHLRLRLAVLEHGLDPDELVPPANGPPPPR